MKKMIKITIFIVCLFTVCIACEGDITRALRHAGYNLSGTEKFVCDVFYGENATETIRFLTATHAITDEGVIYEFSPGKKYSNNQNCRLANTSLRVSSIYDDTVFLANNGGIYRFNGTDGAEPYSEILSTDNDYNNYAPLFYGSTAVKYITVDSNNGIVYGLSNDGNVYGYTLYRGQNNSIEIVGVVIVYNKLDYGDIIDFGYAGNSPNTYVRTEDTFYHLTVTNEEECSKYADIQCNYIMTEDEILKKNKEYILGYNGSIIYTTYGKVFTSGGNS